MLFELAAAWRYARSGQAILGRLDRAPTDFLLRLTRRPPATPDKAGTSGKQLGSQCLVGGEQR